MAFEISYRKEAQQDLEKFPAAETRFILQKIREQLTENPFPHGKTVKKLVGLRLTFYRLRVNAHQAYRVFYQVINNTVFITRIASKKESDRVIKTLKKYIQPG